jgi:hypothetical protein
LSSLLLLSFLFLPSNIFSSSDSSSDKGEDENEGEIAMRVIPTIIIITKNIKEVRAYKLVFQEIYYHLSELYFQVFYT